MLTTEQEIEVLKYARKQVLEGHPFICNHIRYWMLLKLGCSPASSRTEAILQEIEEFLEGESTIDVWLGVLTNTLPNQFRVAIIDTLLARRGVF